MWNLQDDIILILLQYCNGEDIKNTREFQSDWVQNCTMEINMKFAFDKKNLANIIWIKERYNYENTSWHNHIKLEDAKENSEIIKWLYKNGFPLNHIFKWIETLKWLYKK